MKRIVTFLLVLAILFPSTAFADDADLGGIGETVYPVNNTDVVMQKEVIDIRVKEGRSFVTCRFYFKNTGENTKLLMGFPSFYDSLKTPYGEEFTKEDQEYYEDIRLYRFKTYVNGKRVPIVKKKGMKKTVYNEGEDYYPVWYTWNLSFKEGRTKKVTNTYWCYNTAGGGEGYTEYASYILKTGAYWKDKIGSVLVRMRLGDVNPCLVGYFIDEDTGDLLPDYYAEDGTLVWEKKNLEPDRDISVYFSYMDLYSWPGDYEEETEEGSAAVDDGDSADAEEAGETAPDEDGYQGGVEALKSFKSLVRLENHFKQKHYRSTIWWGNRIRRIFKTEKQPEILNYYMGIAYYKRHLYKKAIKELEQCGIEGLYYKALCLKKMKKTGEYSKLLNEMAGMDAETYPGLVLWAKSRLKDLDT